MGINKIVLNTDEGDRVLVDLTGDSVTPETLAEGVTAHDKSGEAIIGTMKAEENLNTVLTEQEELIAELQEVLEGKASDGGGNLGGLTKYAKIIATPSTTTSFVIENPLGGIAKKVSVQRITNVAISSRRCQKYLADFELGIGAAQYVDTSGTARYVVTKTEGTVNNTYFKMTEGVITLYRYNASNVWDNTTEYEVEIWQ